MQLIGMLDSPYVRRVAISLRLTGLSFEHNPLSVFRDYDAFAAINPVVKAPTLVTDDGLVLMDSTLILEHVERMIPAEKRLCPSDAADHAHAQRLIGLALAACEKSVQIVYERRLRPAEKQHEPWIERVSSQLLAAYRALESELADDSREWLFGAGPMQADVTVAVAWTFSRSVLAELLADEEFPRIAAFARKAEKLPAFQAAPLG